MHAGQTVERYQIEELLGEGGMASVYRVRHTQLGSIHALKVLSAGTKAVRDRLMQEGKVQAQLRHPNVVAVTDVIDVNGDPGLVMEFVDGPSLDLMLKEQRPSLTEAVRIFMGVVRGVRHAHGKGLIHRDLKPGNVLLENTEDGYVPKVADFGLVKVMEGRSGTGTTKSGVAMGTPEYMAPEQIRDAANVDHRADMFSLGCIFYELVCGIPPFKGGDMLQVFNKVATGDFRDPLEFVPNCPKAVHAAILGLLEVDVTKRIQDCDALLDLLGGDANRSGHWHISNSPSWQPAESNIAPPPKASSHKTSVSTWSGGHPAISRGDSTSTAPEGLDPKDILPFVALPLGAIVLAAIVSFVFGGGPATDEPANDADSVQIVAPPQDDGAATEEAMGTADGPTDGAGDASAEDDAVTTEAGAIEAEADAATTDASPEEDAGTADAPPEDAGATTEPKVSAPVKTTAVRTNPTGTTPPAPTGDSSAPATVDWKGDARNVWLVAGDKRYPARGEVPPGTYEILAWFDEPQPTTAGRVTLSAGQTLELNCLGFVHKCK